MGVKAGYKYRLRVNKTQAAQLQAVFDSSRFVWNFTVGRWNDLWREEGISHGFAAASREVTDLRARFDWLAEQPAGPQFQVVRDVYRAVAAFFDKANPAGRPRFKKKGSHATARWQDRAFAIKDGRLWLQVQGGRIPLRVVWSRELPSPPKTLTIRRDTAGRWWVTFVVEVEAAAVAPTERTTGLDLGLTTLATVQDEAWDVPNPRLARASQARVAKAQRVLARKTKGSNNRAKAKSRVARETARIANQRREHAHQHAHRLVRQFDQIGVEDLRIKNMLANHHLARAISDAGWGDFIKILDWHMRKTGRELVYRDPRNTTQTCSDCGTKTKRRLGLKDRVFCCEECGLVLDRDRNAARNLNPGKAGPGVGVDGTKTLAPAGVEAA